MFKFDDQNVVRALLNVTLAFHFASYFKIDTLSKQGQRFSRGYVTPGTCVGQ